VLVRLSAFVSRIHTFFGVSVLEFFQLKVEFYDCYSSSIITIGVTVLSRYHDGESTVSI
jgi:hypothetical protein